MLSAASSTAGRFSAANMCLSSSELHTLFRAITDAGGHWSTLVIGAKHHFTLGQSDYQRTYEPYMAGATGPSTSDAAARDQDDMCFIKRPMANLEHPASGTRRACPPEQQ